MFGLLRHLAESRKRFVEKKSLGFASLFPVALPGCCLTKSAYPFLAPRSDWGEFLCLYLLMERPRTKILFTKALSAIAFCPILFSDFTQDQQWPLLCILPAEQKKVAEKGIHIQRLTERDRIERTGGWSASGSRNLALPRGLFKQEPMWTQTKVK